jgi:hypothetical protein
MRTDRPEGFLEKLVVPLKPSGRFPSFLRRYEKERIFCVIRSFRSIRVKILCFEKTMNSKLCSIAKIS